MKKINFANQNNIEIISEFERNNFYTEAYSYDTLLEMLKDNYKMKDNDNIFVINDEDEVLAYIIFHISEDFTDVFKIFVREKNRRQGLATSLIFEVEKLSKRYNSKKIMIEVRSKNINAIKFYHSYGFRQINIRYNYYNNPIDNAIVFEKHIEV